MTVTLKIKVAGASDVLLVKFRGSSIIWRSTSLSILSKIILNEKSRLKKKLNELLLSKKSERLEEEENFIDGKCGDRIYQSFSKIVEEARC